MRRTMKSQPFRKGRPLVLPEGIIFDAGYARLNYLKSSSIMAFVLFFLRRT